MGRNKEDGLPEEERRARLAWTRHVARLIAQGLPEPGSVLHSRPATESDAQKLYDAAPSLTDLLPWVEFLPASRSMLLEDGQSVAAFFELTPVGTEGREADWLWQARDALENALQDAFDELDEHPWVLQFYVQDETSWDDYLRRLEGYVKPSAKESAFTEFYLRFFAHHLQAVAKPGGLFEDTAVTRLPWRGQTRRARLVVYRRLPRSSPSSSSRRGPTPEQALTTLCERLEGGLANAGVRARRMGAADIHDWLLRWFNPNPALLGPSAADRGRFYDLARYPDETQEGEIELAGGDFAQRLFFSEPRSDKENGIWVFDGEPHRVIVMDRLRMPPLTGHITGETKKGGDAVNALFDQMPEGTVMCLTLVATPQDVLEAHLNHLSRKAVGETLASEQTRQDALPMEGAEMPETVRAAFAQCWQVAAAEAAKEIAAIREKADSEVKAANRRLDETLFEIERLEAEANSAAEALEEAQGKLAKAVDGAQQAEAAAAAREAALSATIKQMSQQIEMLLGELSLSHKEARELTMQLGRAQGELDTLRARAADLA